jgi:hypothetical protein
VHLDLRSLKQHPATRHFLPEAIALAEAKRQTCESAFFPGVTEV